MRWRDSRGQSLVSLGVSLARRGPMALVMLGLTVVCALGFGVLALVLSRQGRGESLPSVPILASSALAYGVGVLAAFTVSTRMFRRDEDEGIRALLAVRGLSTNAYFVARVAGLALALAALVGGGSLLTGGLTLLSTRSRIVAMHTAQASIAGVVFGVAFAVVFAPVAMATLGARSRAGGYLALLLVLLGPELVQPWLLRVLPQRWVDVLTLPGALAGLRSSIAPVGVDPLLFGRSVFVLLVVTAVALAIVRAELLRHHGTLTHGDAGARRA